MDAAAEEDAADEALLLPAAPFPPAALLPPLAAVAVDAAAVAVTVTVLAACYDGSTRQKLENTTNRDQHVPHIARCCYRP